MYSLDHIIVLVPHKTLREPPAALTTLFTLFPGGNHAGNKTTNTLILLKSGVYMELIAFIDDSESNKHGHWWGRKTPGTIVDWALTSPNVKDVEAVRHRLSAGKTDVQYDQPNAGGRIRPDGEEVKWETTFPQKSVVRGSIPFWCHDITPRELRVPSNGVATTHPSGAIGVAEVVLVVEEDQLPAQVDVYKAIFDTEPEEKDGRFYFKLTSPTGDGLGSPVVSLGAAKTSAEREVIVQNGAAGVYELVLRVDGSQGTPDPLEEKIEDGTIRIGFAT
jgi:hypothetical protein